MDDVFGFIAALAAKTGYWRFSDPITGGRRWASLSARGGDLAGARFRASLSEPCFTKDHAAAHAPAAQHPTPAGLEVIVPQGDVSPVGPRFDWPAPAPPPAPPSLLAVHEAWLAGHDEPSSPECDSRVLAEIFARLEGRPD